MSHFVITGAVGGETEDAIAPNRLEINDFVRNEDMFSLYIQALSVMSKSSQQELISFFQIGGIHGLPYVAWDGAGESDPAEQAGYCTHGSVLFPTWHRPYVALYEQVLQKHALDIADTYTVNKEHWKKVAADLRQPYWDWASNSVPPAEVISLAQVTITTPDGKRSQVANPLIDYAFHPIEPTFPEPYINWKTTLRQPTTTAPDAHTSVTRLKSILQHEQSSIRSKTYNLLTRVHTWPAFSNHTADDGGSSSNSLEAIHDGIHVDVGGSGHMGDPAVAGFDPIFFLHHCQVDRILSLWSALNPGVWVNESFEEAGTFTIPDGATVDKNTPLTPFWNSTDQNTFWTSSGSVGAVPQQLNYSYPEFNNLDLGDTDAVKTRIAQIVNQLYGGGSSGRRSLPRLAKFAVTPSKPTAPVQAVSPSAPAPVHTPVARSIPVQDDEPETQVTIEGAPGSGDDAGSYWDWTARIHVKKYEIGGSFTVLLFLGAVPEDPHQWHESPHYVGGHRAFVNSTPQHCANCRRQGDLVIEGFVHLNEGISELSGLGSFDPSAVKPYLQHNLHWRVLKVDGTSVQLHDVPSLEVTVSATRMTSLPGEVFPVPEEPIFHHDITRGRQGGARID